MGTRQRQRQRSGSASGRSLVLGLRLRAGCGLTSAIACSIIPSSLSQPSSVSFSSSATQREEARGCPFSYESPRARPGGRLRLVRKASASP
eukprot:scaffold13170_cov60-Phaeocystis_antarctica.AAC.1